VSAVIKFLAVLALIYVLAVAAECLSQLTYHKRSLQTIKENFRRTLLRTLVLVAIMTVSFFVWVWMGWQPRG
jgi:hypothetical protein